MNGLQPKILLRKFVIRIKPCFSFSAKGDSVANRERIEMPDWRPNQETSRTVFTRTLLYGD